jgi:hypothetical protein
MWLVNASLRHPYTVWVGMILVGVVGVLSYFKRQVYLVGKAPDGRWAGLKTTVVET